MSRRYVAQYVAPDVVFRAYDPEHILRRVEETCRRRLGGIGPKADIIWHAQLFAKDNNGPILLDWNLGATIPPGTHLLRCTAIERSTSSTAKYAPVES